MKRQMFVIVFILAFAPKTYAKLNYYNVAKHGYDDLMATLKEFYQNPTFKKIYDSLNEREDITFGVATYTQSDLQNASTKKDIKPSLGMFMAPDEKFGRKHPQIGFWLETSYPLLDSKCGKVDVTTFKGREMVIFQEFSHASQWMYYFDRNIDYEDPIIGLRAEVEVELLMLIVLNPTCANQHLLKNTALKKFVDRYQKNTAFTSKDYEEFEANLGVVFQMLLNLGPSYSEEFTWEDMKKIKKDDFKYLYSLMGQPVKN